MALGRLSGVVRGVRGVDVLTAVLVAAASVVWVFVSPLGWRSLSVSSGDALGVLVVLGMTLPLAFRRRWPIGVLVVAAVCSVGAARGGYATDPADLFLLFGVGAAATTADRPTTIALAVASTLYQLWWKATWTLPEIDIADVLVALGAGVLPPILGAAVRTQRALTDEQTRRKDRQLRIYELEADNAAERERLRIARELHDVAGHHLSAIAVQARGIETLVESAPQQAREELLGLAALAATALQETRASVEDLRSGPDGGVPPGGLNGVHELVASARRAGTEVVLSVVCDPGDVPDEVSRCAFRVVQESLTNVTRHACPRAADVTIAVDGGRLDVRVDSTFASGARRPDAAGYGIVGMRERVATVGGTLHAGPAGPGRWSVHASLPLEPC